MKKPNHLVVGCDSAEKMLENITEVGAFQIMQLITGHAITSAGACLYFLRPGDMFLMPPNESQS